MAHDDKFGEPIPDEEREWLAAQVYDIIVMQVGSRDESPAATPRPRVCKPPAAS